MSLIRVEYVLRDWLWVAPVEPNIGYISPEELACLINVLFNNID